MRAASRQDIVLARLGSEVSALYGILDAARDEEVLPWLRAAGARYACLYDGWQAQELLDVAPYLISLDDPAVRADLVARAWGRAWGVFLASAAEMHELRRHLRRFLRVHVEGAGRMLFRYYDPRVLRAYLPSCTLEEANTFFGPIDAWWSEGHAGESIMRFTVSPSGVVAAFEALPDPLETAVIQGD